MKIWRKRVTESVSQLMSHKAVYRTAPATPGLLIMFTLDGVGPVDNRPSTDKLHHFVKKEEEKSDM